MRKLLREKVDLLYCESDRTTMDLASDGNSVVQMYGFPTRNKAWL